MKKHRKRVCPDCTSRWVDRAIAASGVELTGMERRQLIAALLARRHLLLSGPAGMGKRRLARALASAMTDEQPDRVRVLSGHPWWATQTGDVTRFVTAQINYSLWRLENFVADAVRSVEPAPNRRAVAEKPLVVVVEKMSPAETGIYFRLFTGEWSSFCTPGPVSERLRLFGTLDGLESPELPNELEQVVAQVHLGQTSLVAE